MKTCRDCGQTKPLELMQKHSRFKDGRNTLCSECNYNRVKKWRQENRDKHQEATRRYQKKYPFASVARNRAYQEIKRNRIPSWANLDKISVIYQEAAKITALTGIPHEVDHIIPLQGKTVSGFHVETNLRIIPASENRSKGNKLLDTEHAD